MYNVPLPGIIILNSLFVTYPSFLMRSIYVPGGILCIVHIPAVSDTARKFVPSSSKVTPAWLTVHSPNGSHTYTFPTSVPSPLVVVVEVAGSSEQPHKKTTANKRAKT